MEDRELADVRALLQQLALRDPMRAKRSLPSLADRSLVYEEVYDEVSSVLARALYRVVRDALVEEGVADIRASERALRAARAFVYDLAGWRQEEIAGMLGVTSRTVRSDLARTDALAQNGRLREVASRPLPPVPGVHGRESRSSFPVLPRRFDSR